MRYSLCAAILALMVTTALSTDARAASFVPIDDFNTIDSWSMNPDGGRIQVTQGQVKAPNGSSSLCLQFAAGDYYWGNAVRRINLPPNACSIELDLYVMEAAQPAFMTMWLFERDGDGHHCEYIPDRKKLADLGKGWLHCSVPLTWFAYDPRGNKVRELLTTDRMLIGLGGGAAKVCIANLAFRTAQPADATHLNRTAGLHVERGARGNVAILSDRYGKRPGNANPEVLAQALRKTGYGVTLLKSGDLADGSILKAESFDTLIMPYGPDYPYAASGAIRAYLKSGGSFLSMGGYAFDRPCGGTDLASVADNITAEDIASDPGGIKWLNTRHGVSGDTLALNPDQIGVFDPGYHLKYAARMRAAASQFVVPASLNTSSSLTGYSACSMLGNGNPVEPQKWGRHIPLVQAYDRFGRLCGDVGSIAHNYAGPYAGSSWAFFGVTNTDLFRPNGPMLGRLPAIIDALRQRTYLYSLESDLFCYRDGETVKLSCKVADFGPYAADAAVTFRVLDRSGKTVFTSAPDRLALKPKSSEDVRAEFSPARFTSDLYKVVAELTVGGKAVDRIESGFAGYSPMVRASGLRFRLKGNYFQDGDRPVLMSGTNVTGAMLYSGNENPLVWDADLARMNENGINIMRILQVLPFHDNPQEQSSNPNLDKLPLRMERRLDALVQLCQKHRIALMLDLLDWQPFEFSDDQLSRFGRLIADRYKDAPGFFIDLTNEPYFPLVREPRANESPSMLRVWNEYLRDKYKTDSSLRSAWTATPPESSIGSVPYRMGTDTWGDLRTYDADTARVLWMKRWQRAVTSGLRSGNPDLLVTNGYLQEFWAPNKILAMDYLDFANTHSYTSLDVFRGDVRVFDRRFEGKSITVGEFGSIPDHDKRIRGEDSPDQDCNWFLQRGHYLFGEGGAFLSNWCWKDMSDVVFPWGINYTCDGPRKEILKSYRNQSLLFRRVRPVYRSPEVFLVVPTAQRLGGGSWEGQWGIVPKLYQYVDRMFARQVDFGTIDDQHLGKLPESARVLIYPVPYSIPDDAYDVLRAFVQKGGRLCITGDLSYDALHRRTHTDRLESLCGVRFVSENYPDIQWTGRKGACINVEPTAAKKVGDVYISRIGNGEVYFTPDPDDSPSDTGCALDQAYAKLPPVSDVLPTANYAFRVYGTGGGCTYVLANPTNSVQRSTIALKGRSPVEIELAAGGVGSVGFGSDGRLLSVESQGPVRIGGTRLEMKGHFSVTSVDDKDLSSSTEMVVIPFGPGSLSMGSLTEGKGLSAQAGDVIDARWRMLSDAAPEVIDASGPSAYDIRIIARRDRLRELARFVVSEVTLR